MDKKGKIFQRNHREQPQQLHMINPPPLEEKRVDEEETFEQWRVVNMQYRALFKKKSESKLDYRHEESKVLDWQSPSHNLFESKPHPPRLQETTPNRSKVSKNLPKPGNPSTLKPKKPDRGPDSQLFSSYLTKKLENFARPEDRVKRPALLIESTQEMLRQLPKGESLVEEAEVVLSKKLRPDVLASDPETLLRETIDEMHSKQVKLMESEYIKTYESLCKDIEETTVSNQELEQKIRKFSSQANSENEELEEVKRQVEQIRELEIAREKLQHENFLIEETISLLHKDLAEIQIGAKERQESLNNEIQTFKEKVLMIDNQKVESLEYECKELYREIQDIESDLKKIKEHWEGENKDLRKIMEEFDETNLLIKKELKEISLARAVVMQERENVRKQTSEVVNQRIEFLKSPLEVPQRNPRNLFVYFDNILNHYSRKIRMVCENQFQKEPENTLKSFFEGHFFQDSLENDEKLKKTRDTLAMLKEKHDNTAKYQEKDLTIEVADLVTSFKGSENKAISVSLKSLVQLSPIRHVSPARESSLSSLSRLKDITDKVIRHKRTTSNSSRGSKGSKGSKGSRGSRGSKDSDIKILADLSLVESRRAEHARYLKSRK